MKITREVLSAVQDYYWREYSESEDCSPNAYMAAGRAIMCMELLGYTKDEIKSVLRVYAKCDG